MSTRKPSPHKRALRPRPEDLETRQLLSAVIKGTDIDGDTWSIRMDGPGAVRVIKQAGADQIPTALDDLTQIDQITVAGTKPETSRLVGRVHRGPRGDGKVFFKTLTELHNQSPEVPSGTGLLAVDMPGFWLGNTTPGGSTDSQAPPASISIPDGVQTLRLGGVDATVGTPSGPLSANVQDDTIPITLGLPFSNGTRIIVDQVISGTQPTTASGSQPAGVVQHGVAFNVSGRLNLFQANSIEGDPNNPGGQFPGSGGTVVASLTDRIQGVTGQIGDVRVGGNATNFSVLTNDRLSNFYIGGETRNIFLLTPTGSRNLHFGKGLDTVTINTHSIEHLEANRGAQTSTVIADRGLGRIRLGGDVANSLFLSGYPQDLSSASSQQPPTMSPDAQSGGFMNVLVAGDVTDSVFAASAQPFNREFGTPEDLFLPLGQIIAKVEGFIDNSLATPESPDRAFYARNVQLDAGPVIPPNVPELPFSGPQQPIHLPGIDGLGRSQSTAEEDRRASRLKSPGGLANGTKGSTPRGPRANLPGKGKR